ncbi:hypothetical protein M501DRAFT_931138 [Patellaria atrata CBS 101060]|uniref:Uncharacterized protein n=1 Tax=Patellaria atrata CBS 101060 TaxID=1346257 RepID=A0A9P4SEL0_9PEZI|nr:hypothetical protein M501DRAFT_931138 [Patellaria atrata CBS 101060]
MPTQPSPITYTLRLKFHKTTVLLHVDPLQTLHSLRSDLLTALRQTCPDGTIGGLALLPDTPEEIELAVPRDLNDASKGWVRVLAAGEGSQGVGDVVTARGVRDGGVLAFRFRSGREAGGEDEDGEWDVVLPSYEDAYGVENEGDVGARGEFVG